MWSHSLLVVIESWPWALARVWELLFHLSDALVHGWRECRANVALTFWSESSIRFPEGPDIEPLWREGRKAMFGMFFGTDLHDWY